MNDLSSTLMAVLRSLMFQSPVILTALIGCVLILVHWRALRRSALPAILGLGLFAFLSAFWPVVWAVVSQMTIESHSTNAMSTVFAVMGVIHSILYSLALGLIITAVVVGRSPCPSER